MTCCTDALSSAKACPLIRCQACCSLSPFRPSWPTYTSASATCRTNHSSLPSHIHAACNDMKGRHTCLTTRFGLSSVQEHFPEVGRVVQHFAQRTQRRKARALAHQRSCAAYTLLMTCCTDASSSAKVCPLIRCQACCSSSPFRPSWPTYNSASATCRMSKGGPRSSAVL